MTTVCRIGTSIHAHGHFVQQKEHDRNVMWGKTPKDVLLRSNASKIELIGMEVVNLSQLPALNHSLQLEQSGMVLELRCWLRANWTNSSPSAAVSASGFSMKTSLPANDDDAPGRRASPLG